LLHHVLKLTNLFNLICTVLLENVKIYGPFHILCWEPLLQTNLTFMPPEGSSSSHLFQFEGWDQGNGTFIVFDRISFVSPLREKFNQMKDPSLFAAKNVTIFLPFSHLWKNYVLRHASTGVNFINNLCAHFLYESLFGSFYLVTCK